MRLHNHLAGHQPTITQKPTTQELKVPTNNKMTKWPWIIGINISQKMQANWEKLWQGTVEEHLLNSQWANIYFGVWTNLPAPRGIW